MKLVVGLGNPGRRYEGTRHNIGFEVLDLLVRRHGLSWESAPAEAVMARWRESSTLLAKPLTFMNLSGHAVADLLRYFKVDPQDLLVVVDDVNLELGRLRARGGGSAGGHNGLESIIAQLGTEEFARLRVGVGRGDVRRDLSGHVLARFEASEREVIAEAAGRAADAAGLFVAEGIGPVMNRYNRRAEGAEDPQGADEKSATKQQEDAE